LELFKFKEAAITLWCIAAFFNAIICLLDKAWL